MESHCLLPSYVSRNTDQESALLRQGQRLLASIGSDSRGGLQVATDSTNLRQLGSLSNRVRVSTRCRFKGWKAALIRGRFHFRI